MLGTILEPNGTESGQKNLTIDVQVLAQGIKCRVLIAQLHVDETEEHKRVTGKVVHESKVEY